MELKNTPWDCDTFNGNESWVVFDCRGNVIASNLDRGTAHAIQSLPETLAELERHKRLHQGMLDAHTNAEAENERLKEAANRLVFLHECEQEGIESGQPTPQDWFEAVNELGELLTPKE